MGDASAICAPTNFLKRLKCSRLTRSCSPILLLLYCFIEKARELARAGLFLLSSLSFVLICVPTAFCPYVLPQCPPWLICWGKNGTHCFGAPTIASPDRLTLSRNPSHTPKHSISSSKVKTLSTRTTMPRTASSASPSQHFSSSSSSSFPSSSSSFPSSSFPSSSSSSRPFLSPEAFFSSSSSPYSVSTDAVERLQRDLRKSRQRLRKAAKLAH